MMFNGLWLKALRKNMGLSQNAFAHIIGVSYATVNRWENEHNTPSELAKHRIRRMVHAVDKQFLPKQGDSNGRIKTKRE